MAKEAKRLWKVGMRVTVLRYADVMASTAEEAKRIAEAEGDPGTHDSDVIDWEATSAEPDRG